MSAESITGNMTGDEQDITQGGTLGIQIPSANGGVDTYIVIASSAEYAVLKILERISWQLDSLNHVADDLWNSQYNR